MKVSTFEDFITIENNGEDIARTNYWSSNDAIEGFCLVSLNAGAVRLLVPRAMEYCLDEMRTGKKVTIERSFSRNRNTVDIVFEDGTDSPFFMELSKSQFQSLPTSCPKRSFSVWTESGKQLELSAKVKKL